MDCLCQLPKQNEQRRSDTETRKIGPGNVAISNTTSLYNFQIYKWWHLGPPFGSTHFLLLHYTNSENMQAYRF